MKKINDIYAETLAQRLKWVENLTAAQAKLGPLMVPLKALAHALGGHLRVDYSDKVELAITTNDMKGKAADVLAAEHLTKDEFGRSSDVAEEWGASRSFYLKNTPLFVTVQLPADAPEGCRRVMVGQKTVPVFELKCD